MVKTLNNGLKLIKSFSEGHKKKTSVDWEVITLGSNRFLLRGHGVKIAFYKQSIPVMLLPDTHNWVAGDVGTPESWSYERHAQISMWSACLYALLKEEGFSEEEVGAFYSDITSVPFDQLPDRDKEILQKVPQNKKDMYYFLLNKAVPESEVAKFLNECQLDGKELKRVFHREKRNLHIICFSDQTSDDSILAQMYLLAYKQGKMEESLLEALHQYITKLGAKEIVWSVVWHLLENWQTPLSPDSFDSYVRKCFTGFKLGNMATELPNSSVVEVKEILDKTKIKRRSKKDAVEGYTVKAAARMIGCTDKWLYRRISNGQVKGATVRTNRVITEQQTFEKSEYWVTPEGLESAKLLYNEQKMIKPKLIEYIEETRGIGNRAARA